MITRNDAQHTAAGAPTDELDYTTATETQLRQMRADYQRELDWAPHRVHEELRDARLATTGYQRDATLWHAEAQLLPAGSPERARADVDVRHARHLAGIYSARAELLQTIDDARRQWHQATASARTRYEHAGDELARRGLSRDLTPQPPEQGQLFDIADTSPTAESRHDEALVLPTGTPDSARRVHEQPLLDPPAEPRDIAAAQSLRTHPVDVAHDRPSLADAVRQAEISINRRAHRLAWTAAMERLAAQVNSPDEYQDYGYDADDNLTQRKYSEVPWSPCWHADERRDRFSAVTS